jgi:hypothetical protein
MGSLLEYVSSPDTARGNRFLWIAAMMGLLGSIGLMLWYVPDGVPGHVSGVVATLANDFANGILYRPVFDEHGYGGTRYMPVFIILFGIFIKIFQDPVTAGFCLSLSVVVFLDIGIYLLLREFGVRRMVAIPLMVLPHASISFQLLTLEYRGDFLASALNIWGILLGLKYLKKPYWFLILMSSIAFSGAMFTKFTTVQGFGSLLIFYFLQGRKKSALWQTSIIAALGVFNLFLLHILSGGRMLSNVMACLLGGGSLDYALKTPYWFIHVIGQDPFLLVQVILASFLVIKTFKTKGKTLPYLYFVITFIFTFLIFSSRGTDHNHLMDLLIASVLIIGINFQKLPELSKFFNMTFFFIIAGIIITWLPGTISIRHHMEAVGKPTRANLQYIGERLGENKNNILAENPLVPLMLNQRPILLDAFSLRLITKKNPKIDHDFNRKIENQFFSAVVLTDFSGAPFDELEKEMENHKSKGIYKFLGDVHFNKGFFDRLRQHYFLSFARSPFIVYEPIKR